MYEMSETVLCCVCLVETNDSVLGLFDKCDQNETFLWKILFDVIGVDTYLLKDDMITSASKICRPCSVRLTESYEFQKLCRKNWDKLMLMTSEFMCKQEQEPPDLFQYKCNHCESSFRFECNLNIHCSVNHSNGRSSNVLNDMVNDQTKSESDTIAQQIQVWIEEHKVEIDDNKLPKLMDVANPIEDVACNGMVQTEESKSDLERRSKAASNGGRLKLKNSVQRKDFKCADCGQAFTASKFLKAHIQNAHTPVPPTIRKRQERRTEPRLCPICGKSFNAKNENGYQKHMFHHDPSIGKIKFYQCELCDRKFLGKRSLEEHMNFHLNIRPYECEVETCKKSFIYEQSYKNHKKLHFGKDFECSICRKQFITSTNLKYHLTRVHQGVKKYACNQCDKSYFTLQHLKVHQMSHVEKKFYCDVCNRGITHYASLLSHMLLHTGKPFQCDHCNMAFTHRWRFGKHLAERHSISEIPKKYARKMAEKLIAKDDGGQEQTVDTEVVDQ